MKKLLAYLAAVLLSATMAVAQAQMPFSVVEGNGKIISLDRPAASVFVGNPDLISVQTVTVNTLFVAGLVPGTTNLIVLDKDDREVASYKVSVRADISEAGAALRDAIPNGGVRLDQAGNTVIMKGQANSYSEALAILEAERALKTQGRRVVNRTQLKKPNQVALKVKFVEVSRSDLKRLGFDIGISRDLGTDVFEVLTGSGGPAGLAGGLLNATSQSGDVSVDLILEALESEGVVQILAEPTLTTISGRRARFRAGGEFAIPVNQGDGVIAAEYRSTGVSLDFLPTILPDRRILIEVSPEVSFIDASQGVSIAGFEAPSVSVRSADTAVEVASGQSFAIAGLYEQSIRDTGSGVPGFRGVLGRRGQDAQERELVIFITPYLSDSHAKAHAAKPKARPLVDRVGFILK